MAVVVSMGAETGTLCAQERTTPDDRLAALETFRQRVDAYVRLHRRFEEPLPPITGGAESRSTLLARQYLAAAIRTKRATAQQGDIFNPTVAALFRDMIAEALGGRDAEAFLRGLSAQHPVTHALHPAINERYPKEMTLELPKGVLEHLPPLPEHVQYRVVGHEVALWDVQAEIVVDFVPDAFGPLTTPH
jgi:hypothetical protein